MKCKYDGCNNERRKNCRSCKSCEHSVYRYGLSLPDREKLLKDQEGKCLICDKEIRFLVRTMGGAVVDHDHTTKRVRGILCGSCNLILGKIEAMPKFSMKRIINYIK